jgi:hypothetical protein
MHSLGSGILIPFSRSIALSRIARSSFVITFSSLASFYTAYASIKCCSLALSSFDYSMHTKSINVALGPICSLTRQRCLLLCKNPIVDVLVVFMS